MTVMLPGVGENEKPFLHGGFDAWADAREQDAWCAICLCLLTALSFPFFV